MDVVSLVLITLCLSLCLTDLSSSLDAITKNQSITEGTSLVSKNGLFELGFFNHSNQRFLGIWQKKENPNGIVVWVANQNNPIRDSSGILGIDSRGNAVLVCHGNSSVFWSTNSSEQAESPILQLLDSGNLVLRDENSRKLLWGSAYSDSAPNDSCDDYTYCGPNGMCDISKSPLCYCPKGFKPKSPETLTTLDFTHGCVRNKALNCSDRDVGFVEYVGMGIPDGKNSWIDQSLSAKECREKCFKNCSCVAYSSSGEKGGFECTIWFGDMVGVRHASDIGGQNLYLKLLSSEIVSKQGNKVKIITVAVAASVFVVVLLLLAVYYIRTKRKKFEENVEGNDDNIGKEDFDLPLFNLSTIAVATENFSPENVLGHGGFGDVYKGTLEDGREIAVKRLSQSSGQGLTEFKNEVILIAKLQHRNLVRLLGCCIQGEERLLIYEYMPNKSLNYYIFDPTRRTVLDWPKRFNIILGIARGLIYLHQDSRLRIIHRDLKASNVLLDSEMNPKISDFGMARTFGGDQMEGVTNRVVGTFGYMAPEYAIDGQFSVKSDVFSFGILMLEIVSGKRNRGFYNPSENINLIGHAWDLWNEDRHLELIDECIGEDPVIASEALRCIHVGLLCVQQLPEDRPSMSHVLLMLGDKRTLPRPKEPSFFVVKKHSWEADTSSSTKQDTSSTNDFTISLVQAR